MLVTEPTASGMGGKHSILELQPPSPQSFGFCFCFPVKALQKCILLITRREQQPPRVKDWKISLALNCCKTAGEGQTLHQTGLTWEGSLLGKGAGSPNMNYHQKKYISTKEILDSFFFF